MAKLDLAFAEFFRALRSPGLLLFSVAHPLMTFAQRYSEEPDRVVYAQEELHGLSMPEGGTVLCVYRYRRMLGAILGHLLLTGFVVDGILEAGEEPASSACEDEMIHCLPEVLWGSAVKRQEESAHRGSHVGRCRRSRSTVRRGV